MSAFPTVARRLSLALLASGAVAAPALAADFQADLRPMPVDDETKAFIGGSGAATASYDGRTLTVTGRFEGMPSNATRAHLMQSPYTGVPGKRVLGLTVTPSTGGSVTGRVRLNRAQVQALNTGNLYLQIDSEKAPPGYSWGPRGSLWGWLLPAHPTVAQGVPQQGSWFLPKLQPAVAQTRK